MKIRSQKSGARDQKMRAMLSLLAGVALNSLAQEELPKLQPPLGEIPPTFWEQHGAMAILLAVVLVVVVAVAVWLWLRPKPEVALPPEVEARNALEGLGQQPENGLVVSRASQILRHYVLAAFEFPVGEPTTTEFCQLIAGEERVGSELAGALATFLRECDDRKFAQSISPATLGAPARALELVALGESRCAQWREQSAAQTAQLAGAST